MKYLKKNMEFTPLFLEGECSLFIGDIGNELCFYCDGFHVYKALNGLKGIGDIYIKELFFEEGLGKTYQCWEKTDLISIENFLDLQNAINDLPDNLFIYNLKFSSNTINVSIYDDRDFIISTNFVNKEAGLMKLTRCLLSINFMLSDRISEDLVSVLLTNKNRCFTIDSKGHIIGDLDGVPPND